ncbi:MAG: membrane protein insertase YidC [Treponema sp.]|jgi:YidC/Oxa1 family membrane protein insertase|nr:membrane protein insertase YidC [Treponema sp.]
MEKNTLLAVVLSVVVLIGFYLVQGVLSPPKPLDPVEAPQGSAVAGAPAQTPVQEQLAPVTAADNGPAAVIAESAAVESAVAGSAAGADEEASDPGPQSEQWITIDTDILRVVLSNSGGDVVSYKLKEHSDKEDLVEMVLSGDSEARAFSLAFGSQNVQPLTSFFYARQLSPYSVEFFRDFTIPARGGVAANGGTGAPGRFRLIKRYDFKPNDYMFELTITLDGGYSVPGFNFAPGSSSGMNGIAYTLAFGPQIGPRFEKLDNRYDYRQYITYTNGKRRMEKVNDSNPNIISTRPSWAAISGKYFTFVAVPYLAQYDLVYSTKPEPGLPAASRLYIIRPALNTPRAEDTYRFYLGPKTQDVLVAYNNGNNAFGLKDTQLIDAGNSRGFLSPLEKALKWVLLFFYNLIPNYGIAIILLTLFVKIVFFPLTKKSSEATMRMQALSPKIKELQDKYKDNPQKMNAEMSGFYKKEGYNPLSGCLPMLLQIPIFFAMYNLFNNHFDLRGAMFIPKWIPDLSLPESIWNFPNNFRLPFLGWNALRLLPFVYVGSQLLYGKVTQTPDQKGNTQMKMMLYVMPVMFFFILYDVPSGLLIYWIFSNILTMVQQVGINKYLASKKAAQGVVNPEPVIAPKKKKKR